MGWFRSINLGRKEEQVSGKGRNSPPNGGMKGLTRFLLWLEEPRIFTAAGISEHCESGIGSGGKGASYMSSGILDINHIIRFLVFVSGLSQSHSYRIPMLLLCSSFTSLIAEWR